MTTPQQVLSDEQIIEIKKSAKASDPSKPWGDTLALARAIESATLKAVSEQEPVAWRVSSNDEPELGHWLEEVGPDFSDDDGLTYEPLYAHATLPPAQPAPVDERFLMLVRFSRQANVSADDIANELLRLHNLGAALQGAQAPQATKGGA